MLLFVIRLGFSDVGFSVSFMKVRVAWVCVTGLDMAVTALMVHI